MDEKALTEIVAKIEAVENTATFKAFLIRIGFHSFAEYMELFGSNIFKRKICTDWCLETYPNLHY